ncbi:MAG: dTMP kinase [Candidatus Aenigmatarchaeota archaeon]|nr:dTMP kinase [Candidatus Aenigmarchaeota archaeon]
MFIVIEGIDGAGHTTQADLLKKYFEKNSEKFVFIKTPNKDLPVGKAYYSYLNKEYDLNTEAVFLLCASDVISSKHIIQSALNSGINIISERYITSTIAYQSANGFNFEKAMKITKLIGFHKADKIIYLDISPELSVKRKEKMKKLDRHEEDVEFLTKVKEFYEKQIKLNFLGKWYRVNGEKSIEDVHEEIIKIIKDKRK